MRNGCVITSYERIQNGVRSDKIGTFTGFFAKPAGSQTLEELSPTKVKLARVLERVNDIIKHPPPGMPEPPKAISTLFTGLMGWMTNSNALERMSDEHAENTRRAIYSFASAIAQELE